MAVLVADTGRFDCCQVERFWLHQKEKVVVARGKSAELCKRRRGGGVIRLRRREKSGRDYLSKK